jgi:ketosteroid isomerase-like protein
MHCSYTILPMIDFDPMTHPMEAVIREAYAAFGRGDVDSYLRACTEDFEFQVPGHGGIAGTYVGRAGLHALAKKAMTITARTFREDVEGVMADDLHAVVIARHRFRRGVSVKDYRTVHLYTILDGKLARCMEQPHDQDAFDEAWGPEQATSKARTHSRAARP